MVKKWNHVVGFLGVLARLVDKKRYDGVDT